MKNMDFEATATPQGFNERYEANLRKARTYREAYLLTEQDHLERFGAFKYSDYNSFRVSRCKLLKRVNHVNHN